MSRQHDYGKPAMMGNLKQFKSAHPNNIKNRHIVIV
jgi:hypothetical protein